jgi:hypothetical protein
MSSSQAPDCKTSAEAFALTHVFPNGYRRVGDERSAEQKLLDLQNECFRRMDAMTTEMAGLRAELRAERTARQREAAAMMAAHASAIAALKAEHTKAVAALRAEAAANWRASEAADNALVAQRNSERRLLPPLIELLGGARREVPSAPVRQC